MSTDAASEVQSDASAPVPVALSARDPLCALALTLPVFVVYHLGVIFLPVRNAADLMTEHLRALSDYSLIWYAALTMALGLGFAGALLAMGRDGAFAPKRYVFVLAEGFVYAVVMRMIASYVVGEMLLAPPGTDANGWFSAVVLSAGAGFYEELVFRAALFGGLSWFARNFLVGEGESALGWTAVAAIASSVVFAAWHYTGGGADSFSMTTFGFRAVCGLVLVAIYRFRGFGPAVWTHAVYDVGVLS